MRDIISNIIPDLDTPNSEFPDIINFSFSFWRYFYMALESSILSWKLRMSEIVFYSRSTPLFKISRHYILIFLQTQTHPHLLLWAEEIDLKSSGFLILLIILILFSKHYTILIYVQSLHHCPYIGSASPKNV